MRGHSIGGMGGIVRGRSSPWKSGTDGRLTSLIVQSRSMRIAPGFMLSIIITILGLQNLALWRFLGVFPGWLYVIGILLAGFVSWSMTRMQLSQNHRSEEHTSELQSLMRTSYAVFCLKKTNTNNKSFT